MKCKICKAEAVVALRSHNAAFCPDCYKDFFARQVERGIEGQKLFTRNERVLVALSGGKDSLALMLELSRQGYNVTGLHIDLDIPENFTMEADVTDFNMSSTFTFALTDLLDSLDVDNIDGIDDLKDSMKDLTDAAAKLVDGSKELSDGASTLDEKYQEFDEFDDIFVENEEEWTGKVACYIDEHIDLFAKIIKDE